MKILLAEPSAAAIPLSSGNADRMLTGIRIRRIGGLIAGLGVQAGFLVTVVTLFEFLRFGSGATHHQWFMMDLLLCLQFAVPHSVLLHPKTRKALGAWIRPEFYGLFYCVCTCASLQILFRYWRCSHLLIWDMSPVPAAGILACFYLSWLMLFYSLWLSGLGYQTGLTQWSYWWRGQKLPRREFVPRSLFRWFRHPVYLSFLGLIWFTPVMTADHAVLTVVWTVYIFTGSWLKDERLQYYLGDSYRVYRSQVPGYPLLKPGTPDSIRTAA